MKSNTGTVIPGPNGEHIAMRWNGTTPPLGATVTWAGDVKEVEPAGVSVDEIERIAMSYHDRNGDRFDVPWPKTKSRYRTQVRKMVRNVLDCARLSCIEAGPGGKDGKTHCHREGGCIRASDDATCDEEGQCSILLDIAALSPIGGEAEPVARVTDEMITAALSVCPKNGTPYVARDVMREALRTALANQGGGK